MSTFHTHRLSFVGSRGGSLDARLELPASEPLAYALFAHCFTCSKDYLAPTRVSRALAEYGIAVLRFDFTGLGDSEGDFADTDFSSNVADTVCAADYLREHYEAPKILIGHSLGGLAALAAAQQVPKSVAIVTIAAPSEPAHVMRHFMDQVRQIEHDGEAEIIVADRPFRLRKPFLDDLGGWDMTSVIRDLGRALLVLHSPEDAIVEVEHAERIYQRARHPKRLVLLDRADHLLNRREDAQSVADTIATWAARFIPDLDKANASQGVRKSP